MSLHDDIQLMHLRGDMPAPSAPIRSPHKPLPTTKHHAGAVCIETRNEHRLTLLGSVSDRDWLWLGVFLAVCAATLIAMNLWPYVIFITAAACFAVGGRYAQLNNAKILGHGRAIVATGSVYVHNKQLILSLPEGDFLIAPAQSTYRMKLLQLCREQPYKDQFCVYYDPRTDHPSIVFRAPHEVFTLMPPRTSNGTKFDQH